MSLLVSFLTVNSLLVEYDFSLFESLLSIRLFLAVFLLHIVIIVFDRYSSSFCYCRSCVHSLLLPFSLLLCIYIIIIIMVVVVVVVVVAAVAAVAAEVAIVVVVAVVVVVVVAAEEEKSSP